ncbi:hypothetical protein Purlil1_12543 [Purpureocillium lilacinum]|uniref:Alpha/beta hydrolase fold-3 domain-containing protein n=1 Tax=Purpureocillium lilacinum TaxID=33203 RepID=A0ABR0BGL5_PURLI|nr:hypothetical protein Purlil1_12543 [Purpureocillium lilacinum]
MHRDFAQEQSVHAFPYGAEMAPERFMVNPNSEFAGGCPEDVVECRNVESPARETPLYDQDSLKPEVPAADLKDPDGGDSIQTTIARSQFPENSQTWGDWDHCQAFRVPVDDRLEQERLGLASDDNLGSGCPGSGLCQAPHFGVGFAPKCTRQFLSNQRWTALTVEMSGSKPNLPQLSNPDTEYLELLRSGQLWRSPNSVKEHRDFLSANESAIIQSLGDPPADVIETDFHITVRDGTKIPIRSYSPRNIPQHGSPLIVLYHGGGFCLGGPHQETPRGRSFVSTLGAVVLSVGYRLAPEFPFPTPINDAWDAFKWAAQNSTALGADTDKGFIVGGCSAGANFAAVISLLARDEGISPKLTGQWLCIPTLLPPEVVPAEHQSEYLSQSYKGDIKSFLFAPFNHPKGHGGLVPTYFQICGLDPLRDEGLLYEKRLRETYNIPTRIDIYPGLPHGFWGAHPQLSKSPQAREDTLNGFKWLLNP